MSNETTKGVGIEFGGTAPECPSEQVRRTLRAAGVECIDADETIRDYATDMLPLVGVGVRHGLGDATRMTIGGYGRTQAQAWETLRNAEAILRDAGIVREWREGVIATKRDAWRVAADATLAVTPKPRS